jgi:hydrogenase maturation factor
MAARLTTTVVGGISDTGESRVILASLTGTKRILDLPAGEQLPRIC